MLLVLSYVYVICYCFWLRRCYCFTWAASLLLLLFRLSVFNRSTQLPISDMLDSLLVDLNIYFPRTFFACVIETQTGNVRELNPSNVLVRVDALL